MADQGALDFRSANAMAGDVQHIVNAAHDPKIAVLVLPAAIAGKVTALYFGPIHFLIALRVAPQAAQHARPRLANHEFAPGISRNSPALLIHDFGHNPKKWQG